MTRDDMTERELAEYYDSHRGDTSIWQPESVQARTPRGGGPSIVVSVRFSREELRQLKQFAAVEAITLSEFIRLAALDRTTTAGTGVRTRLSPDAPTQISLRLFSLFPQTRGTQANAEPERPSA